MRPGGFGRGVVGFRLAFGTLSQGAEFAHTHITTYALIWGCVNLQNASHSRLTIDITDQQHQSLKALAALQGKTIKHGRS